MRQRIHTIAGIILLALIFGPLVGIGVFAAADAIQKFGWWTVTGTAGFVVALAAAGVVFIATYDGVPD